MKPRNANNADADLYGNHVKSYTKIFFPKRDKLELIKLRVVSLMRLVWILDDNPSYAERPQLILKDLDGNLFYV